MARYDERCVGLVRGLPLWAILTMFALGGCSLGPKALKGNRLDC